MAGQARYLTGPLGKQTRPKVIEIRHLTVLQDQQILLQDIMLDIFEGETVALLGPPGAGASTLLACVRGQIQPANGEIVVLGTHLPPLPVTLQQQIGTMPHNIERNTEETVSEYLQRFAQYYTTYLHQEQLQAYCTHYQLAPDGKVAHLTHLQSRVLALALALIHDPRLVLLDEPLAGLTEQEQAEFWPFLQRTQREGRTLLSTFNSPLAENGFSAYDLIVQLEQGQIVHNKA